MGEFAGSSEAPATLTLLEEFCRDADGTFRVFSTYTYVTDTLANLLKRGEANKRVRLGPNCIQDTVPSYHGGQYVWQRLTIAEAA